MATGRSSGERPGTCSLTIGLQEWAPRCPLRRRKGDELAHRDAQHAAVRRDGVWHRGLWALRRMSRLRRASGASIADRDSRIRVGSLAHVARRRQRCRGSTARRRGSSSRLRWRSPAPFNSVAAPTAPTARASGCRGPMNPPSLRWNIGWTLGGTAAYSMSQWAVTIAVARSADPTAVGMLALAVALVSPATALASLQLRAVMVTAEGRKFSFGDFFALRGTLLTLAFTGIAAYCALAHMGHAMLWTVAGVALARLRRACRDILRSVAGAGADGERVAFARSERRRVRGGCHGRRGDLARADRGSVWDPRRDPV